MTAILVAAAVGLLLALLGTPLLIRFLHRREYGQFIRQDGPQGHFTKRGTPTMGGLVIILATVLGYGAANLIELRTPRASGILLLFLIVGLGLIGFLDDFEKISKQRSLGLRAWQKIAGQALIGITFSVTALRFADRNGLTPASTRVSFASDTNIDLAFAGAGAGLVLFVLWANFLITAWSNAVNLTDGLDGLAAGIIGIGSTAFFMYTYVLTRATSPGSYSSLAATIVAALIGVCVGFLPHNFNPATIFMGDSGAMQLGLVSAASTIIVTGQIDPGSFDGSRALPAFMPILLPLAVLLLPLTDMIMAIVRRTRKGLSPTHPDRMHMHHRLLAAGHSHRRAVLVMYLWAAVASFPVAAMAFFPLPWVMVGAGIAVLFAFVVTVDLMPGVRHGLRSALRRRRGRQEHRIVVSRNVSGTGEVTRPAEGQAPQGAVVSATVSTAPAHHPEETDA